MLHWHVASEDHNTSVCIRYLSSIEYPLTSYTIAQVELKTLPQSNANHDGHLFAFNPVNN